MAQRIASIKNLRALRLLEIQEDVECLKPLTGIKNLKHLCLQYFDPGHTDVFHALLLNSTSTLRSLVLDSRSMPSTLFDDWQNAVLEYSPLAQQEHRFTALKSLTLCGLFFDETVIASLQRAIDFKGLHELTLKGMLVGMNLLFDHLVGLTTSAAIGLQTLCLDMSSEFPWGIFATARTHPNQVASFRFLYAFDTLTTLEIQNYTTRPRPFFTDPAAEPDRLLPTDPLFRIICRHKNLTKLRITHTGILGRQNIPAWSAATVAHLIQSLPRLQHLEFVPDWTTKMVGSFHHSAGQVPYSILTHMNRMKPERLLPVASIWKPST
jgi:hypothetical protein